MMETLRLLRFEDDEKADFFEDEYVDFYDEADSKVDVAFVRSKSWNGAKPWHWIRFKLRRPYQLIIRSRSQHVRPKSCLSKLCSIRGLTKFCILSVVLFSLASLFNGLLRPSYSDPPQHYKDLARIVKTSKSSGRGNVNNEKVFIAANIVNEDLIRGAWGQSLLSLINLLGEENVFVSIYENDSGLGTRDALLKLEEQFPCNSSVVTGEHVPLSDFPTITLPNGEDRVQRLTYLAEIRNRLLRPLDPSFRNDQESGFRSAAHITFDKILFLNDVYFSPLDAIQLLFSTNAESGRAEYRAACALDFVQLFKLYDTFVVRDTDGYPVSLQFYPWFTHLGSATSRADVLSQTDAVRVRSCWGGMAAFDASLFQPKPEQRAKKVYFGSESEVSDFQNNSISVSQPSVGLPGLPLQFRSNGELFWEAAECCLIFADMESDYGYPSIQQGTGVFINPYIRTAYSHLTWTWQPFFQRFERVFQFYQYLCAVLKNPEHNPRRLHEPGEVVDEIIWVGPDEEVLTSKDSGLLSSVYHELGSKSEKIVADGHFSVAHRKAQAGGFCGERRLFVMKKDIESANRRSGRNWENIRVPRGARVPQ